MKTWTEDNPKAGLMQRKRTAIIDAARRSFLDSGYAQTSMDRIAEVAGVSIKTVYRHFQNKDDLFSAVMQAACANAPQGIHSSSPEAGAKMYPWFDKPPRTALAMAGADYLRHILSDEQIALYRVVTRDARDFPELARRYHEEVILKRNRDFAEYLNHWRRSEKWKLKAPERAADIFAALLRAGIFEEALHGIHTPDEAEISARVRTATSCMLTLLEKGCV